MDQRTEILIAVVVVIVVAGVAAWFYSRQRRSKMLRERFGPEYDRVIKKEGDVGRGEGVLQFREKKRESLEIRPLSVSARADFANRWNLVQARFVDDPEASVGEADSLISEVMETRGYPLRNFEEQADIVSVDHPQFVENYRAAHNIATGRASGPATTETLRKAIVHYRLLFDELLNDTPPERKEARA
jgi:hypothetical protein